MAQPVDDPTLKQPDAAQGITKKPVGVPLPGIQPPAQPTDTNGTAPANPLSIAPHPLATNDPMAFSGGPAGGAGGPPVPAVGNAPLIADGSAASSPALNPFDPANQTWRDTHDAGQTSAASSAYNVQADQGSRDEQARNIAGLSFAYKPTDSQLAGNTAAIANDPNWFPASGNPNATPGFPAGYNPTKPKLDPSGLLPANGLTPSGGPSMNPSPSGGGLSLPMSVAGASESAPAGSGVVSPVQNNGGVGLSAINPDNSLINQTIAPNSNVDRVKLNQQSLQSTIDNILHPALDAASRDVAARSFGAGRGVSGMNRTAQGNLASDYGRQIADLTNQSNTNAVGGSIEDMYRNLGIAQQQQGFQAGQQQNAFGQSLAEQQLQDQLTNSAFGRAATQEQLGFANDPSNIALILSQIFGNQSSQAGNAAAGLFKQQGQNGVAGGGGTDIAAILRALGIGGGGPSTTNANPVPDDGQ